MKTAKNEGKVGGNKTRVFSIPFKVPMVSIGLQYSWKMRMSKTSHNVKLELILHMFNLFLCIISN